GHAYLERRIDGWPGGKPLRCRSERRRGAISPGQLWKFADHTQMAGECNRVRIAIDVQPDQRHVDGRFRHADGGEWVQCSDIANAAGADVFPAQAVALAGHRKHRPDAATRLASLFLKRATGKSPELADKNVCATRRGRIRSQDIAEW